MRIAAVTALLVTALVGCRSEAEIIPIQIAGERLSVEVVDTPEERRQGLMNRESLPEDQGMLFVFESEDFRSFWMKDTKIPLSIAFISDDGVVMEIAEMEPYSLDSVKSTYQAKYALEVNRGTFERLGITPGAEIVFPGRRP